jgi:hypothetical protein
VAVSVLIVDDMADTTAWRAFEPDGTSPSDEIGVEKDTTNYAYGVDRVSARVSAEPDALGHVLRRSVAALDLRGFTELRMSLHAAHLSSAGTPRFLLELRLASEARPLDDVANTWHRLIPISRAGRWETVHCTLDDLPSDIAAAVTVLQLRCAQAPWVTNIDDVVAVAPQPVLDTDRALVTALSGITIDGDAITPVVRGPDDDGPDPPGLDIRHVDVRYAPQRVIDAPARRDYTTTGSREATAGIPYDLDYVISVPPGTRSRQAALLEAVLARLPADGELLADGEPRPIRLLAHDRPDLVDEGTALSPALRYRIGARGPARVGRPIAGVRRVEVSSELKVSG